MYGCHFVRGIVHYLFDLPEKYFYVNTIHFETQAFYPFDVVMASKPDTAPLRGGEWFPQKEGPLQFHCKEGPAYGTHFKRTIPNGMEKGRVDR
jgi:hypothetical protein